jgi:hypothetical protein
MRAMGCAPSSSVHCVLAFRGFSNVELKNRKARRSLAPQEKEPRMSAFASHVLMPAWCPDTVVEAAHARMRSVSHENIVTLYAIFVRLASGEPLPMVLYCPACGTQHIDAPKPCDMGVGCDTAGVCFAAAHGEPERCSGWENPPHRSHLCAGCGIVWRPADIATVGVAQIETQGNADTWPGVLAALKAEREP